MAARRQHSNGQCCLATAMAFSTTETCLKKPGSKLPTDLGLDARCGRAVLTVDRDGDGRPDQFGHGSGRRPATTSSYVYLTYMITGMGKDWVGPRRRFHRSGTDLRTGVCPYQPASGSRRHRLPGWTPIPARQLFWQGQRRNVHRRQLGQWAYKNDAAEASGPPTAVAPLPSPTRQLARPTLLAVPAGLPAFRAPRGRSQVC